MMHRDLDTVQVSAILRSGG